MCFDLTPSRTLRSTGVGEAARLVVVGLERIEKAFDRFANAVAIARYPFARLVLVGLQPGRLERLFAKDGERATSFNYTSASSVDPFASRRAAPSRPWRRGFLGFSLRTSPS